MKYALIAILLFGCKQKLEKPQRFQKELGYAKSNAFKRPRKEMNIPSGWRNKISLTFANHSAIEILRKIAEQNYIALNIDEDVIDKKIYFSCKEICALEAIKRLCGLAGFRIAIKEYDILIRQDKAYEHLHEIAFLSNVRSADTKTNVSSGCDKGGLNIGSSVSLSNKHDYNIWQEMEENLDFILRDKDRIKNDQQDAVHSVKKDENKKSHGKGKNYTINKQAGILIVHGTQKQQRYVHNFLMQLHKRACSQVLIEAKILSVKLNHNLSTGINWNSLNLYKNIKGDWSVSSEHQNQNALKVLVSGNKSTDEIISLLEEFGETYIVSNPTTTVLNNQYAIFKVAENKIYFNLRQSDLSLRKGLGKDEVLRTFSSEINTVPVGTMLSVQPSIDFRNRTITLFIHPTISDVGKSVSDPAVQLMSKGNQHVESKVPVVFTQEMDSTIRLDDGDLVIIGGLIKKQHELNKSGLPGVRKVPVFGKNTNSKTYEEIVIMLRAYIMDTPEQDLIHHAKDYELFKLL